MTEGWTACVHFHHTYSTQESCYCYSSKLIPSLSVLTWTVEPGLEEGGPLGVERARAAHVVLADTRHAREHRLTAVHVLHTTCNNKEGFKKLLEREYLALHNTEYGSNAPTENGSTKLAKTLVTEMVQYQQCCGSGSGIRCLFDLWIRDPGWEKNQDQDPGWTSRIIFPRA
jgi:hypothetical protein